LVQGWSKCVALPAFGAFVPLLKWSCFVGNPALLAPAGAPPSPSSFEIDMLSHLLFSRAFVEKTLALGLPSSE
jgi:hypothetical protein